MSLQKCFPASSAALILFCPLQLCVVGISAPSVAPLLDLSVLSFIIILSNCFIFIVWESQRLTAMEICLLTMYIVEYFDEFLTQKQKTTITKDSSVMRI